MEELNLEELEQKIRNSIPELKDEFDAFEDGSIDRDMITQIMLNHVLVYISLFDGPWYADRRLNSTGFFFDVVQKTWLNIRWNLKSAYLKDQPDELITFLNELK